MSTIETGLYAEKADIEHQEVDKNVLEEEFDEEFERKLVRKVSRSPYPYSIVASFSPQASLCILPPPPLPVIPSDHIND